MKTNVNLFIALILCAVIGGALYFLARPSQESLGWNPDEMYGDLSRSAYDGSAFTNATFSGSSNAGGVALSMQGGSLSSRTRAKSFSYAPATPSPITNTPSPIANGPSPIAYMTSGAEYRSFGGGGNGNMGSAGSFRTNTQSPIANGALSISSLPSPIANSQSSTSFVSQQGAGGSMQSAVVNNQYAVASSSSASTGLFGYELQTTYGVASYGDVYSMLPTRNNVRGKQNAMPNFYDDWLKWLAENEKTEGGWGTYNNGMYTYTEEQLRAAHAAWLAWLKENGSAVTPGMSSFDAWWEWMLAGGYDGYKYGDYTYRWVPVGDILPLILAALLYMIILFVKRNKTAQL